MGERKRKCSARKLNQLTPELVSVPESDKSKRKKMEEKENGRKREHSRNTQRQREKKSTYSSGPNCPSITGLLDHEREIMRERKRFRGRQR